MSKKKAAKKSTKKVAPKNPIKKAAKKLTKNTSKSAPSPAPPADVQYVSTPPEIALMMATRAADTCRAVYTDIPEVQSVGVGRRFRGGRCTHEFAVQILVATEGDKAKLVQGAREGTNALQPYVEGVPTDIMVLGEVSPACSGGSMIRVQGGGLSASLGIDVLTFPFLQRKWLTAAHLIDNNNSVPIGGQKLECVQSGSVLGVASGTFSASRHDAFADFALIDPVSPIPPTGLPSAPIRPSPKQIRGLLPSDVVSGTVWSVLGTTGSFVFSNIVAAHHPNVTLTTGEVVTDVFIVGPGFAVGGDSGSMIMSDDDQNIIGMVRAVSSTGMTVAVDMKYVLERNPITI